MNRLLFFSALIAMSTGCATKVRSITAESWDRDGKGMYMAYWEGNCYGTSCEVGEGLVTWCALREDNSLDCKEQTEINTLLQQDGSVVTSVR